MISEHETLRIPDDLEDIVQCWHQAMDSLQDTPNIPTPEAVLLNRILALAQIGMIDTQQAISVGWAVGKGLLPMEDFDNIPAAVRRDQERANE